MKTRNACVVLAVVGLGLGLAARVSAQPFVMGYTGDDLNYLNVTTGGGVVSLNTGESIIDPNHGLNQGWWSATYENTEANDNHFTGTPNGGADWLNSFYVFDLSYLAGAQATAATLVLNDNGEEGSPPFNLSFWDVTTPAATLVDTDGTSAAIYNDLGSGIEYGSLSYGGGVTYPGPSGTITVTLDAAALAAINADGGYFAIGATLTPSSAVPDGGMTLGLLGMCVTGLMGLKRKN